MSLTVTRTGVVKAPAHVTLVLIKSLAHVSLTGACVVHATCLAAAAHSTLGLLLDLQEHTRHTLHTTRETMIVCLTRGMEAL